MKGQIEEKQLMEANSTRSDTITRVESFKSTHTISFLRSRSKSRSTSKHDHEIQMSESTTGLKASMDNETSMEEDDEPATSSVNDNEPQNSPLENDDDGDQKTLDVKPKPSFGAKVQSCLSQVPDFIGQARMMIFKLIWNWRFFKSLFRVLNLAMETWQAIVSQENGQRKISDSWYLRFSVITALTCLVISLVEIIGEGKAKRAKWRRRVGCCGWFYYPGPEERVFGKFSLYFGVVSSAIQLSINLVSLVINKRFIKFDSLPWLLSFGHLVAAIADPGEVKCNCVNELSQSQCQHNTCLLGGHRLESDHQPVSNSELASGTDH